MLKQFNLSIDSLGVEIAALQTAGEAIKSEYDEQIRQTLGTFLSPTGRIDGNRLREHWFPQVTADVFLSHSHKDEDLALILAGWLEREFGLKTFIDSCVWGYSAVLLKQIDNAYCLNDDRKTYSYEKRNGTTSHVHMMLATALGAMIDNTECLIFLNTPNALTSRGAADETQSPWIYAEIAIANTVRLRPPARHEDVIVLEGKELRRKAAAETVPFFYKLDTDKLAEIDVSTLTRWQSQHAKSSEHPLDVLYEITAQKSALKVVLSNQLKG